MCMVKHMATTLIAGRARVCGWNGKGQIKYSIFPKGANQRTFLPIRARIDWYRFLYWFAHYVHVRKDTCTYAREANQMHKLHAGGQSERSEPISKMHGIGSEEFF